MLKGKTATATVAVSDLDRARDFYEKTLGLEASGRQEEGTVTYGAGGTALFVYTSNYAGTNQATGVTWDVGSDIDRIVKDLAGKGLKFEHYDMPGMTLKGDIHEAQGMRVAWFKDPDANIHALIGA
jgi:catechol 2,3-dioxygenase-like lactoylglutathione lyase family enzyme